jgi:hypothetical protein
MFLTPFPIQELVLLQMLFLSPPPTKDPVEPVSPIRHPFIMVPLLEENIEFSIPFRMVPETEFKHRVLQLPLTITALLPVWDMVFLTPFPIVDLQDPKI